MLLKRMGVALSISAESVDVLPLIQRVNEAWFSRRFERLESEFQNHLR